MAMADVLDCYGPLDGSAASTFLGKDVDISSWDGDWSDDYDTIDFTRHNLYRQAHAAWCYAFQIDGRENFSTEDYYEVSCGLLNGAYARSDRHGNLTGLSSLNDPILLQVLETAVARVYVSGDFVGETEYDFTVRELSLLANISKASVRASLSREGFVLQKLRDPKAGEKPTLTLPRVEARDWLSRRRGFIPNATHSTSDNSRFVAEQALSDLSSSFPTVVRKFVAAVGPVNLERAGLEHEWYLALTDGKPAVPDVAALVRLAELLEAPVAEFAARGVRHLLEMEAPGTGPKT